MKKFSGVLLSSDIDGTILNSDNLISKRNLEAVTYFMENGGSFSVATGRSCQTYEIVRHLFPTNAPSILANGAMLHDYSTNQRLGMFGLPLDGRLVVSDVLARFPEVTCECYSADALYLTEIFEASRLHMDYIQVPFYVYDEQVVPGNALAKILVTSVDTELLLRVRDYINETYSVLSAFLSTRYFLEIMNKDIHKGFGVQKVAEFLGISPEHTYAVGDEENDITMIRSAKIGFATGNAVATVKAAADVILPDHNCDAIAALIEQLDALYSKMPAVAEV